MDAWNVRVSDEQLEQLNLRAKGVLLKLQSCLMHTYNRRSVSEIARLLDCSRPTVMWMQHVLELRPAPGLGRSRRIRKATEAA